MKEFICLICNQKYVPKYRNPKSTLCSWKCRNIYLTLNNGQPREVSYSEDIQTALKAGLSTPCHNCTSHKVSASGYPMLGRSGRQMNAHRFIYERTYGAQPKGVQIRHKCDNPICVNIDHLEPGTFLDNMQDKIKRGRVPRGESAGGSKLKESQILEIRRGELSLSALSAKFHVTKSTILAIQTRKTWKHIQ